MTKFILKTNDHLNLHGWHVAPNCVPSAVIVFIHGIGEHSSRYKEWADLFVLQKIGFVICDLRGHGLSDGKRGDIPNYDSVFDDISLLINKAKELHQNIPVILYGHSLGGNFVLNFIIKRKPDINSAIITSPWLELAIKPSLFLFAFARIMNCIFPSLIQKTNLHIDSLSHNEQVKNNYKNDSLVHDKISVRLFVSAFYKGLYVIKNAEKINVSTLLMHGSEDQITSPEGSRKLAKNSGKVQLKIWDGMFHELHNESIRLEMHKDIMNFIKQSV